MKQYSQFEYEDIESRLKGIAVIVDGLGLVEDELGTAEDDLMNAHIIVSGLLRNEAKKAKELFNEYLQRGKRGNK